MGEIYIESVTVIKPVERKEGIKYYPSRAGLPYGFRGKIALRMGVHPNTVTNILEQGESHPKWWRMVKIFNELSMSFENA